jgi:DNA transformation protein
MEGISPVKPRPNKSVRYASYELQSTLVQALDAPLQMPNNDLDIVGDGIATGPGKLRCMAAILFAREFGIELHDAPVNRLQLKDLRRRWLPRGKRHALEIIQNAAGIHRVGLSALHARPGKILYRPRIDHHHLHILRMVQRQRKLQAVNPSRFQTRIHIDPNLVDLFQGGSRITLSSGSPDLAPLHNRPCDADSRVCDTPRFRQRRRGADLTNKVQALRHRRPPGETVVSAVHSNHRNSLSFNIQGIKTVATDSGEFKSFVLEQLTPIRELSCRAMFGGFGFKSCGTFFALIMDNSLYFAVDEVTRAEYESLGSKCFSYIAKDRQIEAKRYFEVPGDVIEDQALLVQFANSAIVAARAHVSARKPRRRKLAGA